MTRYESSIKQVPYPVQDVYAKLSDLSNLQVIKERINDPLIRQQIPADKIGQVESVVEKMEFTSDSVSCDVGMIGTVSLEIVEREDNKCVKYQSVSSPVGFTLWAQVLPTSESVSKLKLTLDADLNFFMKQMVDKHIKNGIEKMADMLAMIPYN
ncbi:MAG: SRPBCC family protein [Bacteroidaceae bacterium]|jgi:carbon monoxide dehydrogenase subunit G|nr:SRPBCC family protein [Bacteroidaceae bacterium]